MAGPLLGLKIVELAGLGPGPFAAMMLADHGAEVIRVERAGMIGIPNDPLLRGRRSISLDLKREECREAVRRLAIRADGLIEGYRPGVMERLCLGPDNLLKDNPALVYGRLATRRATTSTISPLPGSFTGSGRRNGQSSRSIISVTMPAAG